MRRGLRQDCLLWTVSCLGTMFLGIELGIAIAVAISLAFVIYETARPHTAELGRIPGTTVYRSVMQVRAGPAARPSGRSERSGQTVSLSEEEPGRLQAETF